MRPLALFALVSALACDPSTGDEMEYRSFEDPEYGETRTFARTPEFGTGYPEGIEVIGQRVFVTAPATLPTSNSGPSVIYVFALQDGELLDIIEVQGQDLSQEHAVVGTATDAAGRLYVVETQQGVLRFDPSNDFAQETYGGPVPDLLPCSPLAPAPCSPTLDNRPPLPNDIAFDATGRLYFTDSFQNTIWSYEPGGGEPSIWYQRNFGAWGPNGIEIAPDGETLYFVTTVPSQLHRVRAGGPPTDAEVELVAALEPEAGSGADGIVFGKSGRIYITLAFVNQVLVLDPSGTEFARFPDPIENQLLEVPYDNPASIAWNRHDGSLLIVNHSILGNNPLHFGVLEAWVGDKPGSVVKPVVN